MRMTLTLAMVALAPAVVNADVELFFTPSTFSAWGTDPNGVYAPGPPADELAWTAGHDTDVSLDGYYPNLANFPPAFRPCATVGVGEMAYIWLKFSGTLPVNNAKLQGFDLVLKNNLGNTIQIVMGSHTLAYYMQDDTDSTLGIWGKKRWDGVPPGGTSINPHVLVAVTAEGIRNQAAAVPENLYRGGNDQQLPGTRMALLGAIRLTVPGTYHYELGPLGINFNMGGTPVVQFGVLNVVTPPICRGDCNCNGAVDFGDINPFVAVLSGGPPCRFENCDVNGDCTIDFNDINPFVALLSAGGGPCP